MLKLKMLISSVIIVIIIIIFLYLYNDSKKKDLFTTIERKIGPVDIFYLNNPTNTTITPDPLTNIYHKIKQEDCTIVGTSKQCRYTIVEPST
jgi:hypothetical protein